MSDSSTHETRRTLDVYGIHSAKQAERLLRDFVGIGFVPSVMFAIDWRCRTLVAVENRLVPRFIYAKVGGPASGITQWSIDPAVFSPSLKRRAAKSLGRHLSGDLKEPLRLHFQVESAEK